MTEIEESPSSKRSKLENINTDNEITKNGNLIIQENNISSSITTSNNNTSSENNDENGNHLLVPTFHDQNQNKSVIYPKPSVFAKRNQRTKFTEFQNEVMHDYFYFQQYPDESEVYTLCRELGLERRIVTVWFQNSRQKLKNRLRKLHGQGQGKKEVDLTPRVHTCAECSAVLPTFVHHLKHVRQVHSTTGSSGHTQQPIKIEDIKYNSLNGSISTTNTSLDGQENGQNSLFDSKDDPTTINTISSSQVENTLENADCRIDSAHEINNYNRPDTANSSEQTITQEEDPLNVNCAENAQEEIKNENKIENLEEGDFHMDEDTLEIDETNLEILDEVAPTPNSTKDQSKTPSVPVYTKVPEKAAKSKNGLRKSRRFTVLLDFEEQNALNSSKKNSLPNSNHDTIHSSPIDSNNTQNSSKSLKKLFKVYNTVPKPRRARTKMTNQQLCILEHHFEDIKFPSLEQCKKISNEVDLTEKIVSIWFQNRRAKMRRDECENSIFNTSSKLSQDVESDISSTASQSNNTLSLEDIMQQAKKFDQNGQTV